MNMQIMYDLLKEVRDEQKNLSEKNREHREEAIKWQTEASGRLSNIEIDLREHKEGVIQNREAIGIFHSRLEVLEQPTKIKDFLTKKYLKLAGILGATSVILGSISKILGMW